MSSEGLTEAQIASRDTVPMVFDFDSILNAFLYDDLEPNAENVDTAASRLNRNYYPALVNTLYAEDMFWGTWGEEQLRGVICSAWSMAEFPLVQLDEDQWRELFDHVGYVVDGKAAERPSEPLTLYRGAMPKFRNGWAWTDDRDLAQWFADRPHHRGEGQVWKAVVEPERLLARISEQREGESEYVVDARGMDVKEVN
jgi:hypothetical protein